MTDNRKSKGPSRRTVLKSGGAVVTVSLAAAGVNMFNINHVWSQDVVWDGFSLQPLFGECQEQ